MTTKTGKFGYKNVTASLSEDVIEELDLLGERTDKPRTHLLEIAIKEFLERSKVLNSSFGEELSKKESPNKPKYYSEELGRLIFDRLTTPILSNDNGQNIYPTLTLIAAMSDIPTLSVLVKWKDTIPEFALILEEASNVVAHALADKLVELLQTANTNNANPVAITVKTILDALKQVAPKIFSSNNALTQITEDKVTIQIILNEVED